MITPFLLSWLEEAHKFLGCWIETFDLIVFEIVTSLTRKCKIMLCVDASTTKWVNVFDYRLPEVRFAP